ncbi:hypothetical protein AB205_0081950 [Aquarana catesbeiana]|uniref:Uncharacterized protein n=1 Tax=Aquarana catesbeiana TaxID=8400 RepID=A0A2G9Q863_AQUCT|nr:hypothetical protein AB205_0081950 [Aquarana catesbeiana]
MEDKYSQTDVQCKEEDFPTDVSSNRNLPERCPHSLYSRDSPQEHQEIPQDDAEDDMIDVKSKDINDDEAYGRCDQPKEEEVTAYITTGE